MERAIVTRLSVVVDEKSLGLVNRIEQRIDDHAKDHDNFDQIKSFVVMDPIHSDTQQDFDIIENKATDRSLTPKALQERLHSQTREQMKNSFVEETGVSICFLFNSIHR